jgi:hypothetical protein
VGQISTAGVATDADVMVATPLEVGRTGTKKFGSTEDEEEMGSVDGGEHNEGPHSRSLGQQPPPKLGAQVRNPDEHENDEEVLDGGTVVVDGAATVEGSVLEARFEGIDEAAEELVVGNCRALGVEKLERITVGVTTIIAVDIKAPGRQG